MRRLAAGLLLAFLLPGQTPEEYFHSAGAGFRATAEEQRLFWRPHVERSHERILEAAGAAAGRSTATVLGAGVCTEIPLEDLARRFGRVLLVDMDGASMVEAVESLPIELRSKVDLRVADITTFAAVLMQRLHRAAEESRTAEEALERFGKIFASLEPGLLPARLPPSDLIVSSLVLSTLHRYPLSYADRLLRTRFGIRLRSWEGYEDARRRLIHLALEDHFRLLRDALRPGGGVYLAATVARGPAYWQFGEEVAGRVESQLLPEFWEMGLADEGESLAAAVGRLCHARYGVEREIEAFERLLEAYEAASPAAFETMVDVAAARAEWRRAGLRATGPPGKWWWIEYPCSIPHSPGGFRVLSWILRPAPRSSPSATAAPAPDPDPRP